MKYSAPTISHFILPVLFFVATASNAEPKLKDLAPKKEDHATVQKNIDDRNMNKIYQEEQAKKRVKSDAERETDKIPKKTTIEPTYPPGVKVTIPTK